MHTEDLNAPENSSRRAFLRLAGGLLGAAAAGSLLAACQPATPPAATTSSPPAPTTPPRPAPTAAPQVAPTPAPQTAPLSTTSGPLTFWLYQTRIDAFDQLRLDRLQAWSKQSGVPVETVMIGTSDYNKKIPAAIESKTMPDILESGDVWPPLLRARGLLADVSDIFKRVDAEQKWAPVAHDLSLGPDGKAYSLILGASGVFLISRDDQLKEAGLSVPTTYTELFDVASKAQRPPRTYGIGIQLGNTSDANNWIPSLQGYGVRFADDAGKQATFGNHQAEVTEWISLFADAYHTRKVFAPGVLTWDQTGDNDAFQAGRTLFCFNPLTIPIWLQANKPELYAGTGEYLLPAGPKLAVRPITAVAMTLRADTKLADKATDLLGFLYQPEYRREFAQLTQWGPATQVEYDYPGFRDQYPIRSELAKAGKSDGWPDVNNTAYSEMKNQFLIPRMLQRVISDKLTPEQAFQETAEAIQMVYAKQIA
jgi:multiple sugar transport system substrate-binding protein